MTSTSNHLERAPWVRRAAVLLGLIALLALAACSDDDDDGDAPETGADPGTASSTVEMVPLSSLGLDLPFELDYDPPVPSDAEVVNATEREGSAATNPGYDLTLSTSATYDDMATDYDEYFADFEFSTPTPESQAWSGRATESDPAITVAVIGENLNIAQINDTD